MTKPKLLTLADMEFIKGTNGSLAHKERLLGHFLRIRSSPEFKKMEKERRMAQKYFRERELYKRKRMEQIRMRFGESTSDA